MAKVELTDRFLRSIAPPDDGRIEVFDAKRPGLSFRVSKTRRKSFTFEKRVKGGAQRKHNLGRWKGSDKSGITLAEARKQAAQIAAEAERGEDRVAVAEAKRLEAEIAKATAQTVEQVVDTYYALHLQYLATGDERRTQLRQALAKYWTTQ